MFLQPKLLDGHVIRLEPLTRAHAPHLVQHAEPELFQFHATRPELSVRWFERHIDDLNARADWQPLAIVFKENEKTIGMTCYLDIREAHRGLEIGATWIAKAHHGTRVNPECKYLLLEYAIENLGMLRVQLKTDLRNLHSQRAIEKLGALREGVLRKHMIVSDNYVRDSVMYSVTYEDWPEVKRKLEARLGYAP